MLCFKRSKSLWFFSLIMNGDTSSLFFDVLQRSVTELKSAIVPTSWVFLTTGGTFFSDSLFSDANYIFKVLSWFDILDTYIALLGSEARFVIFSFTWLLPCLNYLKSSLNFSDEEPFLILIKFRYFKRMSRCFLSFFTSDFWPKWSKTDK